ncbi:hypothetical protein SDC9_124321 [bioreactor metagenome]|uniref:Uncharacterized protein n=1 Tax=bioreactor metagenome TaxID=1076179 RepID=A0A645CK90_9ZZZZ
MEDGVVQLASHGQRPPGGTGLFDGADALRLSPLRGLDGDGGRALVAVDVHGHMGVAQAVSALFAFDAGELHALGRSGALAVRCQLARTLRDGVGKLRGLGNRVHQPPVHRALAAHAFHAGAEDVGQIVAHVALVGHAGESAGAGQHAQQRHLRQRDGRRAVVDQHDVVAGQCQLIAAASAGTVYRGDELQPVVARAVFHAVARLVGELAEVHLPGVRRHTQHEDVGARAEDAVLAAGDDDAAHLGVLEADAVERVVQLYVHAQVVAVELELVAGADAAVLGNVELHARNLPVHFKRPVSILRGIGAVVHGGEEL